MKDSNEVRRNLALSMLADPTRDITHDEVPVLYAAAPDNYRDGILWGPPYVSGVEQVYELFIDGDLQMRKERGNRDLPVLASSVVPAAITYQRDEAFVTYHAVTSHLVETTSGKPLPPLVDRQEFDRLFDTHHTAWQTDVYPHIAQQLVEHDRRYALVATPNVPVDHGQIENLANAVDLVGGFGLMTNPPLSSRAARTAYSPEQLSGAQGDSPVRFSLVPLRQEGDSMGVLHHSSYPKVEGTTDRQLEELRLQQAENPTLDIHIPSVLAVLTLLRTLEVSNSCHRRGLSYHSLLKATFTKHIDLPTVRHRKIDGGQPATLVSCNPDTLETLELVSADCVIGGIRLAIGREPSAV